MELVVVAPNGKPSQVAEAALAASQSGHEGAHKVALTEQQQKQLVDLCEAYHKLHTLSAVKGECPRRRRTTM